MGGENSPNSSPHNSSSPNPNPNNPNSNNPNPHNPRPDNSLSLYDTNHKEEKDRKFKLNYQYRENNPLEVPNESQRFEKARDRVEYNTSEASLTDAKLHHARYTSFMKRVPDSLCADQNTHRIYAELNSEFNKLKAIDPALC